VATSEADKKIAERLGGLSTNTTRAMTSGPDEDPGDGAPVPVG
jgi:hypothetical protein